MADDWIPLAEAANISGLSASHLRLLARSGRLASRKLGRDWFTTQSAIRTYLANEHLRSRNPRKRAERSEQE